MEIHTDRSDLLVIDGRSHVRWRIGPGEPRDLLIEGAPLGHRLDEGTG